jgi:hypothetical protein
MPESAASQNSIEKHFSDATPLKAQDCFAVCRSSARMVCFILHLAREDEK